MSFWTTRAERHTRAGDVAALIRLLDNRVARGDRYASVREAAVDAIAELRSR